jgi:hypothetical protein
MQNITLNIGGGIGAAIGALIGVGLALLIASPDSPNFGQALAKLSLGGLVVGAIALNFAWDAIVKKKT